MNMQGICFEHMCTSGYLDIGFTSSTKYKCTRPVVRRMAKVGLVYIAKLSV